VIVYLSDTGAAAMLEGLLARLDADSGAAQILLYAGTQPAAGGTPTGALQATIAFTDPVGTVSGRTLTVGVPIEGLRVSDGNIAWARITDNSGDWIIDTDAGGVGSGAGIELESVTGYTGAFVRIVSGAFTL
jgi:hypothetical protein